MRKWCLSVIYDGYCTLGTERDTCLTTDDLLRSMDDAGVERAVIVPEDRELAVDNASGNDRILRAAARWPDRLVPACGVNPWYGPAGVRELNRCAEIGSRLLVLSPALQGFLPIDDVVVHLLACASQWKLPVYVHTGPHSFGGPTQIVLLAEKHSDVNFIVGHCGSTDHAWDMPSVLRHHLLPNLWFELSFVRPWVVPQYVELAGPSKFIWGSSAPRNCQKFELAQLQRHLPAQDYPDIYFENANRLFGNGSGAP